MKAFDVFFPFYTMGTCAHYWFTYDNRRRCHGSYSNTYEKLKTSLRLQDIENKLNSSTDHWNKDENVSWFRNQKSINKNK